MDLEIIVLSEVSQKKTNIIWEHLYVESKKKKKKTQMNLFPKQKESYTHRIQTYGYQRGKGWGEEYIRRMGLTYTHHYI